MSRPYLSYLLKPLPVNLDEAIMEARRQGLQPSDILQRILPVVRLWLEYPGNTPIISKAQEAFERRLRAAGYPIDEYLNEPLRYVHVYDYWALPYDYENDKRGRRIRVEKKRPDGPIPFLTEHSGCCNDEEGDQKGWVYFPVPMEKIRIFESSPYQDEGKENFRRKEGAFFAEKVGVYFTELGRYPGHSAPESTYLRHWKRFGLSAEEILLNLGYLLEHRHRSVQDGLWVSSRDCNLEFPARIQSGRGCPGALGLRWPVRGSL
ncbi:hypothetical protein Atc_1286 [Acidithiobacillus caldus SM-1]|uniref:Uncharacterized protein n=1 Tax=Acidithiobacillus caldus (strain SM-1) TaxID=990288 RepID=F9ZNV5_ACICS|nr:hypothetical protein [Acidithiobacillus caldus]AEK57935.1 hypothetical protein Atc_1286 [Acidithiobacillus caldus SM-1]QER44689.1 hypothetical protein F0726_01620 [Acidithiobacillus caldus]